MYIFQKFVKHIQVSIKSHKNNGTSHKVQYTFLSLSPSILLQWICFRQKFQRKWKHKFRLEKVLFKNLFFFKKRGKFLHTHRPLVSIWRMRITRWITKDTNIVSRCKILVVSKTKLVARTRLNCTFYIHILIVQSNFYLHVQFTPQRTHCDSIRKTRRFVYCKNLKEIINTVCQNVQLSVFIVTAVFQRAITVSVVQRAVRLLAAG